MGLTQSAIGKYESGDRPLLLSTIYEMYEIFGGNFLSEIMGFTEAGRKHDIFAKICHKLGYNVYDAIVDENGEIVDRDCLNVEERTFYTALRISYDRDDHEYVIKNRDALDFMDRVLKHVEVDFKMLLEGADNGKAKENNR